ncbi:MAG TPA: protein kinase, partial [Anaerolineales bacterium]|nr:protein kinase [Anaerolineales bacterium]
MIPEKIGRYEIRAELGRGGMATVYQGHDPRFMREVAIKVLPREFLHDPNFRARFEREARTIAALEHPAIVPVYDFGEEEGQPYIVMRLMNGGSLADRLAHGPIALTEAARIFGLLAPALDRAHSKGIIHRDLKPGNILFDEDGLPYIADFGIAKLTAATSAFTGTAIVGTPAYMSPEQARGDKTIDGRSDIYALGTIVFQMLTGKVPFDADTPMGVALKHITEPVPSILESRPNLPADCDTLIQTAMAKSRDERFPTAGRMAEALTAIASGKPSLAPPPVPTPEPRATLVTTPPPQPVRAVKEKTPPPKPATGAKPVVPTVAEASARRSTQQLPASAESAGQRPQAKKRGMGLWLTIGGVGLVVVCVVIGIAGFAAVGPALQSAAKTNAPTLAAKPGTTATAETISSTAQTAIAVAHTPTPSTFACQDPVEVS